MRTAVITFVLALLVAGCGTAASGPPVGGAAPAVGSISPSDVTTKIVGGTPMQQKVMREVLAGLGPTTLTEVEIQESEPSSVLLVVPHDQENVLAEWQSWLLAQAFAQRSRQLELPTVAQLAAEHGATDGDSLGPVPAAQPRGSLSDA